MRNMKPCKFTFDDSPVFDGFAHGSTWNGFDNVAVTASERDRIVQWMRETAMSDDDSDNGIDDFLSIAPMENGLFSLGWGYATQIVPPAS